MRNIALVLSYDGTAYHGFQAQRAHVLTVQGVLESALAKLTGVQIRLTGAGRTDAGVHAAGQVVNFRTEAHIPIDRWPFALNGILPHDIVVKAAYEVPASFHARFSAQGKTYRYTMDMQCIPNVFYRRFAWHTGPGLNIEAMRQAANLLVGQHDFNAFCAAKSTRDSHWRNITGITVEFSSDLASIEVTADGFLYHMVRIITGTLVEIGKNRAEPQWVAEMLTHLDGRAGQTAPAHGLCLVKVAYPPDMLVQNG